MRRWLLRLSVVLALAGAAGGAFLLDAKQRFLAPGPLDHVQTVVVPRGANLAAIAHQLKDAGVVADTWSFTLGARWQGKAAELRAGEYAFPPAVTMPAVLDMMRRGETVVHRVTVPEGLTVAQILDVLAEAEGLAGDLAAKPPEGALLPETYHYSLGDTREALVKRMEQSMRQAVDILWERRRPDLPLKSKHDALVMASIVERETALAAERPHVAAVFLNRLKLGMRLQSDPTVIYGLSQGRGVLDRGLTYSDLQTPHPWNTYVIAGLPPTAIANPGRASLEAVLNPMDSKDLYFVANGAGGHVFAPSLAEHNHNVAKWRVIERNRREMVR